MKLQMYNEKDKSKNIQVSRDIKRFVSIKVFLFVFFFLKWEISYAEHMDFKPCLLSFLVIYDLL